MLKFKIKEILLAMGIEQPYTWLLKNGKFGQRKTSNLLRKDVFTITLKDLSKLCILLHCTPNDLLYWQMGTKHVLDPKHPCLHKLFPPISNEKWQDILKKLPQEEVLQIHQSVIERINKKELD